MNPCTLGWYLPLLVQDVPGALQPSEGRDCRREIQGRGGSRGPGTGCAATATATATAPGPASESASGIAGVKKARSTWEELDAKFRRDLPDAGYVGRLGYRGLVMRACPRIRLLDGVEVCEKERAKAEGVLRGVLGGGDVE